MKTQLEYAKEFFQSSGLARNMAKSRIVKHARVLVIEISNLESAKKLLEETCDTVITVCHRIKNGQMDDVVIPERRHAFRDRRDSGLTTDPNRKGPTWNGLTQRVSSRRNIDAKPPQSVTVRFKPEIHNAVNMRVFEDAYIIDNNGSITIRRNKTYKVIASYTSGSYFEAIVNGG